MPLAADGVRDGDGIPPTDPERPRSAARAVSSFSDIPLADPLPLPVSTRLSPEPEPVSPLPSPLPTPLPIPLPGLVAPLPIPLPSPLLIPLPTPLLSAKPIAAPLSDAPKSTGSPPASFADFARHNARAWAVPAALS